MTVLLNNKRIIINVEPFTLEDLVERENIPSGGTAIAINGKIAKRNSWGHTTLKENDNIVVISAAYGG